MVKRDPQGMFEDLMRTNPKFRDFYEQNKDKPVSQLLSENGLDLNILNFL